MLGTVMSVPADTGVNLKDKVSMLCQEHHHHSLLSFMDGQAGDRRAFLVINFSMTLTWLQKLSIGKSILIGHQLFVSCLTEPSCMYQEYKH